MSDASTKRMIEMYMEEAEAPMFLSGHFRTPPQNIHDTEMVELDVTRDDEDIAVVVTDLSVGGRPNESSLYTNKGFTPPIFKEEGPVRAYNLLKRAPGANPFEDPRFGAEATRQAFQIFRKLERKIRRAVELMCSQVLQTGVVTLEDKTGAALYSLDFQAKATHFVTVGTEWAADGATGDPLGDLESLARVIRRDGKKKPNKLVFGSTAWQRFVRNADVQAQLDNRRINTGVIEPQERGEGGNFEGYIWVGQNRFEMWSYEGYFRPADGGSYVSYVDADKVIMLADEARLDLTFGSLPRIRPPEERALQFLPTRFADGERGLVLTTNSWFTADGETLMVSAGTRPLAIPTAIDTFGTLDVVP